MHNYYMELALIQARKAADKGEVPVGALVVDDSGAIIARGHNLVEAKKTQAAHAESIAIAKAGKKLNNWRLTNCRVYVTLEPCSQCIQLIVASRVKQLIYGAPSPLFGYTLDNNGAVSIYKNSHFFLDVISGHGAQEAAALMQQFFKNKRI